jgi:flagellar protein FliS
MKNPALAYRQLSVQSATPIGLVVMLYDGAIAALQQAITAIEARDISKKCTQLNRALAIILQLEGTLNFEAGGEVAQTLKGLYTHARGQMLKANIDNSPEILRPLVERLSAVREAWYEADHRPPTFSPTPAHEEQPWAPEPISEAYPGVPASAPEPGSWHLSA